ncbi:v-type proton atpase subunit e [Quercus suber]|uniref:V-type proton atpase subunit e n=1 Tax=Quercus suber TaxID=58331 RepID=A0AAW0JCN4_QUESU
MQLNASWIKVLQAQDDIFNAMKEATLKDLLNVSRDHHVFKKLLKVLIVQELNCIAGVDKTCKFVKVGHLADQVHVYVVNSFTFKCFFHFILFFLYQNFIELLGWKEIEIGDGLPNIRLTGKCLEALKQAGFEVSDISYFILFFVFALLNLCYDLHK